LKARAVSASRPSATIASACLIAWLLAGCATTLSAEDEANEAGVAVITTESQEARASAAWYRSVTSTTEVYRCAGAR